MTEAITKPFVHVEDANGDPYVGAKLYVYLTGTTTLASIYSDDTLSSTLANPLTSDTAGNFLRAFIADGTYKLRAETSAAVLIWEYDDIDTGTANGGVLPIASGGTSAITAAAARTALGAAAITDVTTLAATVASVASSIQTLVVTPQGRLTLVSGAPVISTDVAAGTSVYYTPYVGTQLSIFDGSAFQVKTFAELTLALAASHAANNIYDIFIFLNSGTVTIGTGPAWTTATAGAGARGAGAGTTELTRQNGLWVNAVAMTTRNGATTYSVDASRGTYVGSMIVDGTNGQVSCHVTYGQTRRWGVWNAYNRAPIIVIGGDATASWTYASATVRASNGDATNLIKIFSGLPEERVLCKLAQKATAGAIGATTGECTMGIGFNVTNAFSGTPGSEVCTGIAASTDAAGGLSIGQYMALPSIGVNNIQACEATPTTGGGGAQTFYGTQGFMLLSAEWRG